LCWRPASYGTVADVLDLDVTSDFDQPVSGLIHGGETYWLQARVRSVQRSVAGADPLEGDLEPRGLVVERCKLQRATTHDGRATPRP
jgi:hypothetical protein